MDVKKLLATVVTAGVIVTGTAGAASAATGSTPTTRTATTQTHSKGHHDLRRMARRAGAKVAASTIGIDVKTLAQEVRSGKSVADVAREHGVSPQKVIDAVVTAADKKIDEWVANGKLSASRAATLKSKLPALVTRLVNRTHTAR